eukprot:Nk52_evm5s48 gene=Nk52_evmTU5s48
MRSLTRLLLGCFMLMLLCGMLHLCNCVEPNQKQEEEKGNQHQKYVSFAMSLEGLTSEGNVCHRTNRIPFKMNNLNSIFSLPKHKVIHSKYQDVFPRGFCAGITKAIGLHLLFNYAGPAKTPEQFAEGYSEIVKSLYNTGHLFHLWEMQKDAAVLVKSIAIEITNNKLSDLLDLKEDEGEKELLAALPNLFPTFSTKWYDKIFNAAQFSSYVKMIFEDISPEYPFAFIPVSYAVYKVNVKLFNDNYDPLKKPPKCNEELITGPVCSFGAHETAFIVTPHFLIYHDSNRFHHEVWTFDSKKDMREAYSSIEETIRTYVLNDDLGTGHGDEAQECLKNSHDTIAACVTYLWKEHKKNLIYNPEVTFKVGSINIESLKTKLQNQAKFNMHLKEEYRGRLTADVFQKVIEDHLSEIVKPPLQTFIEALSPAGVRDSERVMWTARKLLNEQYNDLLTTPPEPKIVGTLYCLATGSLHKIKAGRALVRGLVGFERSVLIFDLLMLLFSDPKHQKIEKKSTATLCQEYEKKKSLEKSTYSDTEIFFIESICTDGKLRQIYHSKNFLNPDKKDLLATQQVSAELHRYYKCFTANVVEGVEVTTPDQFEDFLRKDVIPVIYHYGYSTYLHVKENMEKTENSHSPQVVGPRIAPLPYHSQISNWIWPAKHTEESGISDSIKAFLGQSLFFTYAVPKLLTFLPTADSLDKNLNSNDRQNLKSNLQCALTHLLDKLNTVEECQSTRHSGLRTDGSYLYVYMRLFRKGKVNLFTFLYYMLKKCDYVSQKEEVKQETLDGFKSIGFPLNEVDEYVNLFVTSFKYYKHSVIFSKDTVCGEVISKIEDGYQYLYALVRLIALHHEFQKVAFDCKGPHPPPFLENKQLCYFPEYFNEHKLSAKM